MTTIEVVGPERAAEVLAVVHAAFRGRPALDPPATALDDTLEVVEHELAEHGGLLASFDEHPVGAMLFRPHGRLLGLRRVGVLEDVRGHGVGPQLAAYASVVATRRGYAGLVLEARQELPATVQFWQRLGYVEVLREGPRIRMLKLLPVGRVLPSAEDTRQVGKQLGTILAAGDVVVLTGELGAGKTTLTQGIAEGLGVRGPITSPTFVIARLHPSLGDGPALVHADAYRLGDAAELDDLDLDTDLDTAVTVVEWGTGMAEALSGSRLEIVLHRAADDVRTLTLTPVGPRWIDHDLVATLA